VPSAAKPSGDTKTATQSTSADAAAKKAGATADATQESLQPKPEAVKDVTADQTEFQRFVAQNTGRALPLFGYGLFADPGRYAPVLAAPVPSAYVLGPGDELVLQTYGIVDVAERLVIDRNGRVSLPKAGQLQLAGLPFSDAEKALNAHLSKVYTNFTLSLTMGRLRSIEVFVLGQAAKPGKHVVSGLSTLINALFETGGASSNGSLRQIELRRGGKTVTTVDLYKFLALGDASADARLQSGDVIYIPAAGDRAALLGTINAPAIYELKSGETIANILALSGGLPVLAAPQKAQLERVDAKQDVARTVEDFALDDAGLKRTLKSADILTVFQVSPQIANVVTLEGNVAAPMRYALQPGMRVSDLLSDPRLLIPGSYWLQINRGANSGSPNRPEVNLDYATIQRLDAKTLSTRLIAFSPAKAMAKDERENLLLQSGDIITVYSPGQAGPATQDSIALNGELIGGLRRFPWREGMTLKDLIPSTQWLIEYYNYWQRPSAQSLRNDINWDYAQIIRRNLKTLQTESVEFNLGQQVMGDAKDPNFKPLRLQAGDQIALFTTSQIQVPIEKRIQFVTVRGEVATPGNYQIKPGETLPQLIQRAGGLTANAFPYGTVFSRESTRVQQQANLDAAIRRLEAQISSQAVTNMQNVGDSATGAGLQAQIAGQRLLLSRMQNLRASGRIALDLVDNPKDLPALFLEDGDAITVPNQPNFVGVFGAVQAETSFIHKAGTSVGDYIAKAGPTREADLEAALLIRGDGTVLSNNAQRSWFGFGNTPFMQTRMQPGDSVFVPEVVDRRSAYTQFIQGAKDWTAILYQFGIGAAALKTLK
jgi:protein involved in polysaccharide export with SLBB domain